MSQIVFVLKNKEGLFLAQVSESAEKVWIGSGNQCQLSIPDPEIESIEIEMSIMDGACWMHVSQEAAPAKIDDKAVRSAKIDKNTTIQFKDYFLEVIFKVEETLAESTRLVEAPKDDKTLELEKTKMAAFELTFSQLRQGASEKTRVIDSKTRVISEEDSLQFSASKGQPLHKQREDAILDEIRANTQSLPSFLNDQLDKLLRGIKSLMEHMARAPLLTISAFVGILTLTLMFGFRSKELPNTPPDTIPQKTSESTPADSLPKPSLNLKARVPEVLETTTTVSVKTISKEAYLDSMSRLFNQ